MLVNVKHANNNDRVRFCVYMNVRVRALEQAVLN